MEILSDTLFRGNVTIDEDQKLVFQTPSIGNNPTSTISQQSRGNSEVLVIDSAGGGVHLDDSIYTKIAYLTDKLIVGYQSRLGARLCSDGKFCFRSNCSSLTFDYDGSGSLQMVNLVDQKPKIKMTYDGRICAAGSLNLGGDISANNVSANNISVSSITSTSGASFMGNNFTCVGIVNTAQSNWSITHGSYTNTFPQKSGTLATVDDIPTLGVQLSHTQLKLDASTIPADCTAFSFGNYPIPSNSTISAGGPSNYIISTQAYLLKGSNATPVTYPAIEIELVCGDVIGKKASGLSLEGTLGVNMLAVI